VQLSADRAIVLASQDFRYGLPSSRYLDQSERVSSYAPMQRLNNQWVVGKVQRVNGLSILELADNGAGKIIGVLDNGNDRKIATLNVDTLEWQMNGELPNVFSPFPAHTGIRNFYVSRNALAIEAMGRHTVPKWAQPWSKRESNISADAVFYSTNWGRSWTRLAIDGYIGVLGIDAKSDRVVWGKGNWYNSEDLGVRTYGLK
jgi:hypothetical protein